MRSEVGLRSEQTAGAPERSHVDSVVGLLAASELIEDVGSRSRRPSFLGMG